MFNPSFARGGHHGPFGPFGRFGDRDWDEPWHGMGPGFGRGPRVDRGLVKYLILSVLQEGPKHGYEIMRTLEERSQGAYVPSAGAIYPTLQLLEDLGHLRSQESTERKVFELTDAGRADLAEHQEEVDAMWKRLGGLGEAGHPGHEAHRELREELGEFARTLFAGGRVFRADPTAIARVRDILRAARKDIEAAIGES